MLLALLADNESSALERVFRVLEVLDPSEEFEVLLSGLRSADARRRESGRELLVHVVPEPLRTGILAMLGDGAPLERLRQAARFHEPLGRDALERSLAVANGIHQDGRTVLERLHIERLRDMLLDPSEAVRAVARYRVAELGITALQAHVDEVPVSAESALATLPHPIAAGVDPDETEARHAS
jgi:hypothetical protein